MLKVTVQGVYESDVGSGQKKFKEFNYTVELTRENPDGIATHLMKRIVPYLIAKDKNKKEVPFSRIKSLIMTNIEHIDKKSSLLGKDILELNDWEIQDLACLFDLYEVPLYGKLSIYEVKYKTAEAYLKKVLGVPMKDAKEKMQSGFFKQQADGTFKLDFGSQKCTVEIPDGYFEKEEKMKEAPKTLAYYYQKAGMAIANAVLSATGNEPVETPKADNAPQNSKSLTDNFPSAEALQK